MQCEELSVASLGLSFLDWPSREDHCVVVYFNGCSHDCDGCHSPKLQKHCKGSVWRVDRLADHIMSEAKRGRTDKVVFSGGDPLFNHKPLQELINYLKLDGLEICIYTGYEYEEAIKLINSFNFIKTGKYERTTALQSQKTNGEFILASRNQKIYDHLGNCLTIDGVIKF